MSKTLNEHSSDILNTSIEDIQNFVKLGNLVAKELQTMFNLSEQDLKDLIKKERIEISDVVFEDIPDSTDCLMKFKATIK